MDAEKNNLALRLFVISSSVVILSYPFMVISQLIIFAPRAAAADFILSTTFGIKDKLYSNHSDVFSSLVAFAKSELFIFTE